MLMRAKEHYRRYIAIEHAFPDRTLHLQDANLIIAKTRAQFEADGFILEEGLSSSLRSPGLVFTNVSSQDMITIGLWMFW